jgi:hypothetical protein
MNEPERPILRVFEAYEHSSAPIDFKTSKVILQR